MSKIKKPTYKIVLRKNNAPKDGKFPVNLRVTFNRKPKYWVLKGDTSTLYCEPEKWNSEIGRYNRDRYKNNFLEKWEESAKNAINATCENNKIFSFNEFARKCFNSYSNGSVEDYFQDQIELLKGEERIGSMRTYKDTLARIKEFRKTVTFQEIDLNFLQSFEKFLKAKGNSVSSIGIYLRTLRAVYNKAIKDDLVSEGSYPFKEFTIRTGKKVKKALRKEDMIKLWNNPPQKGTRMRLSWDLFMFSYLCRGMNFKDIIHLTWTENIINGMIVFIRAKTANSTKVQEPIKIKIHPNIQSILNNYQNNSPFIFPILEEGISESTAYHRKITRLKKVGKDIRKLASELEIPNAHLITFYWARHTFATVQLHSGESESLISELMGHSSLAVTKAYLDSFGNEVLDNTINNLL